MSYKKFTNRTIHTTIPRTDYDDLLSLGKGVLKDGISIALKRSRAKELKVQVITEVNLNEPDT